MPKFQKLTTIAAAAALFVVTTGSAHALTIVKPFLGGPFSPSNSLGTIQAIKLDKKNTYDFTFTLSPAGGSVLTQIQASISGPTSEPIQYTLFAGSPGSGTIVDTSTLSIAPSLTDSLGTGDYYVEVDFIAKNNELLTGGLDVAAVPEPAAWGMMLFGLAGLGAALRLNRRKPVALAA